MCRAVLEQTGLLPHPNAGLMSRRELAELREVSPSQGLMLETVAERLCGPGGPHEHAPDKLPSARLAMIRKAGELRIPFTSGILIGIGETALERVEALLALRDLHEANGHIQEVIVQNFRAKPDTPMGDAGEPGLVELMTACAIARLVLGPRMNIQAPPNLSADYGPLLLAGINDWGGISPLTPDFINPEAPWPELGRLGRAVRGRRLRPARAAHRLPRVRRATSASSPPACASACGRCPTRRAMRSDAATPLHLAATAEAALGRIDPAVARILDRSLSGEAISTDDALALWQTTGPELQALCQAADELRRRAVGDAITYVVNRNINWTNICFTDCSFCAFGVSARDPSAYFHPPERVTEKALEACARGATEVCMQGGLAAQLTPERYLEYLRAVKDPLPEMHVHAFSPAEIDWAMRKWDGSLEEYLTMLRQAGLDTIPGTAAEILVDEVRARSPPRS